MVVNPAIPAWCEDVKRLRQKEEQLKAFKEERKRMIAKQKRERGELYIDDENLWNTDAPDELTGETTMEMLKRIFGVSGFDLRNAKIHHGDRVKPKCGITPEMSFKDALLQGMQETGMNMKSLADYLLLDRNAVKAWVTIGWIPQNIDTVMALERKFRCRKGVLIEIWKRQHKESRKGNPNFGRKK